MTFSTGNVWRIYATWGPLRMLTRHRLLRRSTNSGYRRHSGQSAAKSATLIRNDGRFSPIHETSSKQDCEDQSSDHRNPGLHIRWGRWEPDWRFGPAVKLRLPQRTPTTTTNT